MIVAKSQLCTTSKDLTVKPASIQGSRHPKGNGARQRATTFYQIFCWAVMCISHPPHYISTWPRGLGDDGWGNILQPSGTPSYVLDEGLSNSSVLGNGGFEHYKLETSCFSSTKAKLLSSGWLCSCGKEVDANLSTLPGLAVRQRKHTRWCNDTGFQRRKWWAGKGRTCHLPWFWRFSQVKRHFFPPAAFWARLCDQNWQISVISLMSVSKVCPWVSVRVYSWLRCLPGLGLPSPWIWLNFQNRLQQIISRHLIL